MLKALSPQTHQEASTDNVDLILEAHLEQFTKPCIQALVDKWSDQNRDQNGKRDAVLFLYRAANDSKNNFRDFLKEEFGDLESLDNEEANSYRTLDVMSDHCTGTVKDNSDPIWGQCRRLFAVNEHLLAGHIGKFFKEQTNLYLSSSYPELFEDVKRECENLDKAANDRCPTPDTFSRGSSQLSDTNLSQYRK